MSYQLEETIIYEIDAETLEEAREIYNGFVQDGYHAEMPLKLYYVETSLKNEEGEEV